MTEEVLGKIFDILLLILCSAVMSASEASFFSIQPNLLSKLAERNKRSKWNFFNIVYERPVDVLIMIILGNEFINITATAMMTSLIITLTGDNWKFLSIIIMLPLILVFGEIIPKVIAIHYSELLSRFLALPAIFIYRILFPFIMVFRKITTFFTNLIYKISFEKVENKEQEDLNVYLELGEESGVLEPSEKHLLENIFNLDRLEVWEIMRSRREIFYVHHNTPVDVLLTEINKKGYAKVPVVENNIDNIKGVLHVKDLLAIKNNGGIDNWHSVLRKPVFVFRTRKISSVLKDMREKNFTICFIVNEYGRVVGLATMTDILQTIFKGVESSITFPGWMSEQLDDGSYIISQSMLVELFNEFFDADLPAKNFKTMGRFLKSILGHNPQLGESVEYGKWIFLIESAQDKKSKVIRVKEKSNV